MVTIRDYSYLLGTPPLAVPGGNKQVVALEAVELGALALPTGRIIACDPYLLDVEMPFARTVPPGSYPVRVCVAHLKYRNDSRDQRIAFALVQFQPDMPARWEMAVVAGADLAALHVGEFYGYGVDAGTGSFMDAAAMQALKRQLDGVDYDSADERYFSPLSAALDATYTDTRCWANYEIDAATRLNMVAFSSGVGDGEYASYWGLDENNAPLCLVTDFDVVQS